MDRRSFLKLMAAASPLLLIPELSRLAAPHSSLTDATKPNIIILLLDAMSARNLSLYGYSRSTTPHLERFAERATVYHSHYAAGNYTIPGTASILTGTYPWTHRAINFRGGMQKDMIGRDIFSVLGSDYTRIAFPQNFWADLIVSQLDGQIDQLLPVSAFSELDFLIGDHFVNDRNMASRALDDFVFKMGGRPVSLVLGSLERLLYVNQSRQLPSDGYPDGIPYVFDYPLNFRLDKVFDGISSIFSELETPFFTYFHLLPPHAPYVPVNKFHNAFRDGLRFEDKPIHPLSDGLPAAEMLFSRRKYDEYIASTDEAMGKFLDFLENNGYFENSYIFIMSDHGEMFERGEIQHSTPLLYDPVIHTPLLVSAPGQKTRRDIYTPTSAVDILPTIAHLTGQPLPSGVEGSVLPGFENGNEDFERSIYVVEAKLNPAHGPMKDATIVLRKGHQKLIYYTGYGREDEFELYDLEYDSEEMDNLFPQRLTSAKHMKDELLEMLFSVNKPYTK